MKPKAKEDKMKLGKSANGKGEWSCGRRAIRESRFLVLT